MINTKFRVVVTGCFLKVVKGIGYGRSVDMCYWYAVLRKVDSYVFVIKFKKYINLTRVTSGAEDK